jgi:hypothetical protein
MNKPAKQPAAPTDQCHLVLSLDVGESLLLDGGAVRIVREGSKKFSIYAPRDCNVARQKGEPRRPRR